MELTRLLCGWAYEDTKTEKSRRTLSLPQMAADALRAYKMHKLRPVLTTGAEAMDRLFPSSMSRRHCSATQYCSSATGKYGIFSAARLRYSARQGRASRRRLRLPRAVLNWLASWMETDCHRFSSRSLLAGCCHVGRCPTLSGRFTEFYELQH
jgi:hypothetical protein